MPNSLMEWKITVHQHCNYVEVVTHGIADKDGSLNMAKAISETMRHNRITKVLIDHRNIEKVSGSVVDIYDRPKLFRIIGIILGIKIAEIIKTEHTNHFRFFETVCLNRGFNISIFHDKHIALEWLIGKRCL